METRAQLCDTRRVTGNGRELVGCATQCLRSGGARWTVVLVLAVIGVVVAVTLTGGLARLRPPPTPASAAEERRAGAELAGRGQFSEAATAWTRALELEDDPTTRRLLADALARAGRLDEAHAQYSRLLARDPRNADTWYAIGNLLRDRMHDLRGAVEAYRNAIEEAPQMADAHFRLGAALMDLKDWEAAIAEIQAALQIAPTDVPWRADAESALALARLRFVESQGLLPPPPR